jgi:predicted dehydrogenase
VGAGGRALGLNRTFSQNPDCEIVAIADVDANRLPQAVEDVTKRQVKSPATTSDFRRLIDDSSIDAIVVATPDHWHAIPTILACQAGKDVYVEKPDGHNIVEGQRMVAAMKKHGRIVQMGSQHRSTQRLQTALEFIRTGALGRVLVARAWESTKQGSIGHPPDSKPPAGVDYDMWLGPAPQRPFNQNRFHGRWRWFYDYGTGDLGNDGVHRLDMAFAALNAACEAQGDEPCVLPARINAMGSKRYFDDDQEFPDTMQVTYEYATDVPKILTYEMRIWAPYQFMGESEGAAIFGDNGFLTIGNKRWRAYNSAGLMREETGDSHEAPHVQNFLDCIKSRKRPLCDLETVGHPASVLCHAGNIAARVGRSLQLDPVTETFLADDQANALRGRSEWRKPWELPEV